MKDLAVDDSVSPPTTSVHDDPAVLGVSFLFPCLKHVNHDETFTDV